VTHSVSRLWQAQAQAQPEAGNKYVQFHRDDRYL